MFWKKKPATGEPSKPKAVKLPGPTDIPELVGRYLVTQLKRDPDWVWQLKGVVRPRPESKDAFDFRVFSSNRLVKDYNSLDDHPDLILYHGWFDKKSMKVQIEEKKAS